MRVCPMRRPPPPLVCDKVAIACWSSDRRAMSEIRDDPARDETSLSVPDEASITFWRRLKSRMDGCPLDAPARRAGRLLPKRSASASPVVSPSPRGESVDRQGSRPVMINKKNELPSSINGRAAGTLTASRIEIENSARRWDAVTFRERWNFFS
jgi:hypothetical protein